MREFIKSFFSFGLATSAQKAISFLLLPIYTRLFTKEEFGVIDLVQVLLAVTSIFAVLQLETALQRFYYEHDGRKRKVLISSIFVVILFLSCFLTLILIIFSQSVSQLLFETQEYSSLIQLASLQLPFANMSMLGFVILRYEKRNVVFVSLIFLKVFTSLGFILLFVIWMKMGLFGIFYAQLIALVISTVILMMTIKNNYTLSFSVGYLKESLKYSLPQFPARIGSILLSYANRFFMVGYLSLASIGIYSLSLKMASAIQLVYSAFIMAWGPFIFEQQQKNVNHKEVFSKALLLISSPVFLLVSGISLFSIEIISLVASEEYIESAYFIGGLSLYFSLFIFKEVVDIGPKFTKQTEYLSYTFFLSVIVNITSLYFLVTSYGLYGVVISMIVTNSFLLMMSWFVSNRLYYISFNVPLFVILALPAFFISVFVMFYSISFGIRIVVFCVYLFGYGFSLYTHYRSFRLTNNSA